MIDLSNRDNEDFLVEFLSRMHYWSKILDQWLLWSSTRSISWINIWTSRTTATPRMLDVFTHDQVHRFLAPLFICNDTGETNKIQVLSGIVDLLEFSSEGIHCLESTYPFEVQYSKLLLFLAEQRLSLPGPCYVTDYEVRVRHEFAAFVV
jgi:hypothetical protein